MSRSGFDRNYALVTIGVIAVIMHGSLYPYAFRAVPSGAGPLATLVGSWAKPPTSFGDFVANVLLYMPLGFFGVLAWKSRLRLLLATALGLVLCTTIEIVQFYDQGRVTNMSDVYLNTLGTLSGAIGGILIGRRTDEVLRQTVPARSIPGLLLLVMLGYRLFPYVPVIDLHKYWHSLKPIALQPNFAPWPIFRYFALWLTACWLIDAVAGRRRSTLSIAAFIPLVFGARILIAGLTVTAPDLAGATAAVAVWLLLSARAPAPTAIVAAILCVMVALVRLEPFDFSAAGGTFSWLPFRSYLRGSLEIDIVSFLEKFFLYGSLIWIGSKAGLRLAASTGAVAVLLFVTSFAEIHLRGRSAEITDTVMALFIGGVFMAMTASACKRGPGDSGYAESVNRMRRASPPFKFGAARVPTVAEAQIAGMETERKRPQ